MTTNVELPDCIAARVVKSLDKDEGWIWEFVMDMSTPDYSLPYRYIRRFGGNIVTSKPFGTEMVDQYIFPDNSILWFGNGGNGGVTDAGQSSGVMFIAYPGDDRPSGWGTCHTLKRGELQEWLNLVYHELEVQARDCDELCPDRPESV